MFVDRPVDVRQFEKLFSVFDAKSSHVAVSAGISRECSLALIYARSRSDAHTGDRVS